MTDGMLASFENASSATFHLPWKWEAWNLRWYDVRHKMFFVNVEKENIFYKNHFGW